MLGVKKLQTSLNHMVQIFCDIFNSLRVDHECNSLTDRPTDRQRKPPIAIAQSKDAR